MAKVSMEHDGFWGAIQLGNTAGLCGSIRAVKLELSHCIRTTARWKVLSKSKKSVVWASNQPFSVKLTGSTALAQQGPRSPSIYIHKYPELDRQAGRQACRHRQGTTLPQVTAGHVSMNLRRILTRPDLRRPEVDSNPVPRGILPPAQVQRGSQGGRYICLVFLARRRPEELVGNISDQLPASSGHWRCGFVDRGCDLYWQVRIQPMICPVPPTQDARIVRRSLVPAVVLRIRATRHEVC